MAELIRNLSASQSMVYRCVHGIFNSSLPMTIGASFAFKKFVLDDTKVRLQIWDTAGQERFRSMVSAPARCILSQAC